MTVEFDYTNGEAICSRLGDDPEGCGGLVFPRVSRSGLTRSHICEEHARKLDKTLDEIEGRYPEIHHHEDCLCPGCIGDAL